MSSSAVAALRPVVDALVDVPARSLWPHEVQELLTVLVPQVQRLQGFVSQLLAQLPSELPTDDGGGRTTAGWVAETTRETPSAAGRDLRVAQALRSLPGVVEAVLDGRLTQSQAAVLSRLVGKIPAADLAEAEPALVEVAGRCNPSELAAYVRHLLATHCEPTVETDEASGQAARYLQHTRQPDGSLRGRFVLSPEDSEVFLTVLEPLARRQGTGDDRSAGQRRADALVDVCDQAVRHGNLPEAGGQRPQLTYVLPAGWASGEQARAACTDCRPCLQHEPPSFADTVAASLPDPMLDGLAPHPTGVPAEHGCATAAWSGPQTRARIEATLCDARISKVLLDGVGQVRNLESLSDSVTPTQRRALAARDLGCATRGCTRPPAACDAHHLTARADGGDTTLHNLVLLCRRHHVLWHLGKITLADLHVPWRRYAHGDDPPAA